MKPLRTAILGYGRSGSTLHADPIEALDAFSMSAVCDIDPKARAKAGERFGCALYKDYHEMIEREPLDLIVIVTRTDQHAEMVCDCLRAGHHVLITKPWAVNEREARRMAATARRTGKLLLPWLPARWGTDFIKLRELIRSGIIGKVNEIRRTEYSFSIRHDWQTRSKFGGGLLLNWGPHMIDPPVLLAGGRVKSVFGKLRQAINPGDVEDNIMSVITMENGITVISEHKTLSMGSYPNWLIQGTKGTIILRETQVEIHKMSLPSKVDARAYGNSLVREIIHDNAEGPNRITIENRYGDAKVIYPAIADAVRGIRKYPVTLDSAVYLSRILDAVRRSSEREQVVHFK